MGKSNAFSASFLNLIFNGVTMAGLAQNVTSGALTSLYVALHTADPGAGGNQNTSECSYGSYARVGVLRNSTGWTLSGTTITPNANIVFPAATSGSQTATYFSIGTAASGAGQILYSGPISPPISITTGVTPELLTGTTVTEA